MKIAIVTDAWAPQVNGVVRTLQAVRAVLEVLADAELSDEDSVLAEPELAEELASVELVRPSPRTVAAPNATATMSAMQMVPIAMLRGERFGPTFAWAGLYVELRVGALPTGVPQSWQ